MAYRLNSENDFLINFEFTFLDSRTVSYDRVSRSVIGAYLIVAFFNYIVC